MKKLLTIIIAIILFYGCKQEEVVEKQVVFSTNYLSVESGQLKSFDIDDWKHFYWPYEVVIKLTNKESGVVYTTNAANSYVFFTEGTEPTHLPLGEYNYSVIGGGWKDGGNALPYFVWSIKDSTLLITETTDVVKFELTNSPALIVKDAEVPIGLKGIGMDTVLWTGRGAYDFVYVTAPWPYAANYNNKYITIEAQQNYYYYLIADSIEASYTVTLPELTGDTIIFN